MSDDQMAPAPVVTPFFVQIWAHRIGGEDSPYRQGFREFNESRSPILPGRNSLNIQDMHSASSYMRLEIWDVQHAMPGWIGGKMWAHSMDGQPWGIQQPFLLYAKADAPPTWTLLLPRHSEQGAFSIGMRVADDVPLGDS